jgi:glycosyltransferase involved in cell wall biosynthesis
MDISFVIPIYNEENSIRELYDKIVNQMLKINEGYEIIFVDDGSNDKSFEILKKIGKENANIKIIKLRKNFGKSVALSNGFNVAKNDIIITMDSDLQDDPMQIPDFIDKILDGYDLVSGWKQDRKDPVISKNIPSKLFNYMIGLVSGLKLHDYNCGFKAYRKILACKLPLYGDLHRFTPAIAFSMGFKVVEIPVKHHARPFGHSKYGLDRFTHGLFDFITVIFLTKFLKRPMHLFGCFGILSFISGFVICLYLSMIWFSGERIGHRPLLSLGILLLILGMQFISTGLIAEMITFNQREKGQDDYCEIIINHQK